jgi:hypothetical protein
MGRKTVVELKCDRCGRTEHNSPDSRSDEEVTFMCSFKGKLIKFGDLCSGCTEVVATHVADIMREMKKVSPLRSNETRKKAVAQLSGAPVQPSTPIPTKPTVQPLQKAPGLGEKSVPHGPSQRP